MHHQTCSKGLFKAAKLLLLPLILALFLQTVFAAEVISVPTEDKPQGEAVSLTASAAEAQEGAKADPMVIELPLNAASEPGLEENIFTEFTGMYYFLMLDDQLLVASPDEASLLQLVADTVNLYVTDNTIACALSDPEQLALYYGHISFGANFNQSTAAQALADTLLVTTTERTVEIVTVPMEQLVINDPTRYTDEGDVVDPGADGLNQATTESVYINGKNISSTVISSDVLIPMESEVTYRPTLIRPEYIWPAEGRISSHYGPRNIGIGSRNHKGLDIAANYGSDILASKAGIVICSGRLGGYGKVVKIDHGDGSVTVYAHNSSLTVAEGDWVEQGDVIAKAGNTGTSSGTHCHFEILIDDEAVDPELYLPAER